MVCRSLLFFLAKLLTVVAAYVSAKSFRSRTRNPSLASTMFARILRIVLCELYAQTLIVVAFLVVYFFSFLVITRNPTMRFGPKLEEIFL